MAKLDQAITMTLGGGIDKTLTIEAGKLPLDANYIVNAKAEISTGGGDQNLDVTVNVGVDGDFENEPKPAAFEVGSYVDAAGNATVDKSAAVAVVYHVGAIEGDEASLYPAAFAGKTIKGYAVALENTIKGRQQLNKDKIAAGLPSNQEIINGTQNTSTLVDNEVIGASDMIVKYKEFVAAHTLTASGSTTTDWYIPAQPQMQAWISMLMVTTPFPSGDNFGPTGTDAFKALFPMTNIFRPRSLCKLHVRYLLDQHKQQRNGMLAYRTYCRRSCLCQVCSGRYQDKESECSLPSDVYNL